MADTDLAARRSAAIARGVGVTTQVYAERAENAEIWDASGRRYIDFAAGIAVVNTGHRHPKVLAAVREQIERFTHTCHQVVPYESYVALAERLNAATPGAFAKKTVFVTTGAEAVENAVKIARGATGRSGVIAFGGAFHGRTFLGMALTGKVAPYKVGFGPLVGDVFRIPKGEISKVGARVMGLDDPEVKMSKSLSHRPGHSLDLLADDRTLRKAVMSAVTDSDMELRFEHASRGVRNLLELYGVLRNQEMEQVEAEFEGGGYGTLKKALADAVVDTIAPLRDRHAEIVADEAYLDAMLARGAARARELAGPVVQRARDAMGVG